MPYQGVNKLEDFWQAKGIRIEKVTIDLRGSQLMLLPDGNYAENTRLSNSE